MTNISRYKTRYKDQFGEEETWIENDGRILRMALRGMVFEGHHFDGLSLVKRSKQEKAPINVILNRDEVCNCEIEWDMPITMFALNSPATETERILHIYLTLGKPTPIGNIDRLETVFELRGGPTILRSPVYVHFETGLNWIQARLAEDPSQWVMKICINCDLSDYNPVGQSMFGSMGCFRAKKDAYRKVQSKDDIFDVWGNDIPATQETDCCEEFCIREKGRGYCG